MIIYDVKRPGDVTIATFFKESEAQTYIDRIREWADLELWIDEKKLFHTAFEALTEV